MNTLYRTETYTIITCAKCSMGFATSDSFATARRADRKTFYCPAGHSQWFPGKTDAKVIEELRAQVVSKNDLLASTRQDRDTQWRLRRAAEGKTRAIKTRISSGVCPCCTRTFQNLARHMKSKHPAFPSED